MNLLEEAIALAVKAHRGQVDKGGHPYILHPLRLMLQMETENEMVVAVLHDVVEDSETGLDDLRAAGFPEEVISAIECLTKRKGEDYDAFIRRAATNPLARRVKIADLEDNMNLARISEVRSKDLERLAKYHRSLLELRKEL